MAMFPKFHKLNKLIKITSNKDIYVCKDSGINYAHLQLSFYFIQLIPNLMLHVHLQTPYPFTFFFPPFFLSILPSTYHFSSTWIAYVSHRQNSEVKRIPISDLWCMKIIIYSLKKENRKAIYNHFSLCWIGFVILVRTPKLSVFIQLPSRKSYSEIECIENIGKQK